MGQGDAESEGVQITGLAEASTWRRVFAWSVFPVVFFGSLIATWLVLMSGMDAHLATLPAIAVATILVALAERVQPRSVLWTRSYGDVKTDLQHVLFSQLLPPPVMDAVLAVSAGAVAIHLSERLGHDLWPSSLHPVLQLVIAMILGEFGQYWWHRTCHERAWFWRFHATHHSAPRLWWLNAARFHPLDTIIAHSLTQLPLVLLGAPPEILALVIVFTAVHGLFQHSNIDLRLGPLNWVFSMAELHRWHHSRDLEDANTNYGANIIFWDVVFGTRHLPATRVHNPADVGFAGDIAFPRSYFGQLATPFRWATVDSEVAAAAGDAAGSERAENAVC